MKNVWLKDEAAKLLKKARLRYVRESGDTKITDDKAIREALRGYVNGEYGRRDSKEGEGTSRAQKEKRS